MLDCKFLSGECFHQVSFWWQTLSGNLEYLFLDVPDF